MRKIIIVTLFIYLIFFPSAILRITMIDKYFWYELFFRPFKPDLLIEDIDLIKKTYNSDPKIIIIKDNWPEGPYTPFLEWTMYMLDIDMVSSFLYLGTLYDLLVGNPSKIISRPNPLPSNSIPVIENINDFNIFILTNSDKKICFYNPNPIELLILDQLSPNLYVSKRLNSSQVDNWTMLYKSIQEEQLKDNVSYFDSSFSNWEAKFGKLILTENGAKFLMDEDAPKNYGWIKTEGLHIDFHSHNLLILSANALGGIIDYIDIYSSQNQRIGRCLITVSGKEPPTLVLDMRVLNLPPDEYIWKIAIIFRSVDEYRTFQINFITFFKSNFNN